jgi:hypothetical protein
MIAKQVFDAMYQEAKMRFMFKICGLLLIIVSGFILFTPITDIVFIEDGASISSEVEKYGPAGTNSGDLKSKPQPSIIDRYLRDVVKRYALPKAMADALLGIINVVTGFLGAWFTYMGYRLQSRADTEAPPSIFLPGRRE